MLALGIDPGTAITGYGFVRELTDGGLEVAAFGVIETPVRMSSEKRLLLLYDELKKLIFLHRPEC